MRFQGRLAPHPVRVGQGSGNKRPHITLRVPRTDSRLAEGIRHQRMLPEPNPTAPHRPHPGPASILSLLDHHTASSLVSLLPPNPYSLLPTHSLKEPVRSKPSSTEPSGCTSVQLKAKLPKTPLLTSLAPSCSLPLAYSASLLLL